MLPRRLSVSGLRVRSLAVLMAVVSVGLAVGAWSAVAAPGDISTIAGN